MYCFSMDTRRYLKRILFTGKLNTTLTTLQQLQHHHLFSVPFEDLDIFYGIPVALNTDAFYKKIVLNNRGGYCYELNGLFYLLLKKAGFHVNMISARFVHANGKLSPEFDHMALLVVIDNTNWLVDVGFGDFSLVPLQIKTGLTQKDGRNTYLISDYTTPNDEKYFSVGRWQEAKKAFIPQYIFSLQSYRLEDFAAMNRYQQTSPHSHFVKNLMCSLPTDKGRTSIINNRLIETTGHKKKPTNITSEAFKEELLKEYFAIDFTIPEAYVAR